MTINGLCNIHIIYILILKTESRENCSVDLTDLLLQSHDCVNPEVPALAGIGDAHRAGQEQTGGQHLQAAP